MTGLRINRVVAGLIALIMIVGMFPMNMLTTAFAEVIESYTVELKDGEGNTLELDGVKVALTNKENAEDTMTVETDKGVAVFENFTNEGTTYIVSVDKVEGYEEVPSAEVTIEAEGENTFAVEMTPIVVAQKITISGTVYDSDNKAYSGATIKIYIDGNTEPEIRTTAKTGIYSFDTYAGVSNKIVVTPADGDKTKYSEIVRTAIYTETKPNEDFTFGLITHSVSSKVNGVGGTINGSEVIEEIVSNNSSRTFTVHANTGYVIDKLMINGVEENAASGKDNYVVNATITKDYTLEVSFRLMTFNVVTFAGGGGSITEGSENVEYGSKLSFNIEAAEDYYIDKVTINGVEQTTAANKKEFKITDLEIKENCKIEASFYHAIYTVSFNVKENGEVAYGSDLDKAPGGEITNVDVNEGGELTFKAVANPGFHVKSVKVDDVFKLENGTNENSTFTDTIKDIALRQTVVVEVVFEINKYIVEVDTSITNGKVTLSTFDSSDNLSDTKVDLNHGEQVFVMVVPDAGYDIVDIKIGDVSIDYEETINGYETIGTKIFADSVVYVEFAEKDSTNSADYIIEYPEKSKQVGDVVYVADGGEIKFSIIDTDRYKRIRVYYTYIGTGWHGNETEKEGDITGKNGPAVIAMNSDIVKITGVALSTDSHHSGWTNPDPLNIVMDNTSPTISIIENSGKWHKSATTYSFTVSDAKSGVKEVLYSATNDISTATILTPDENGKYTFDVSEEFNGKYYIWAVDYCGNTKETTVDVKIDTTAPIVTEFMFSAHENNSDTGSINFAKFATVSKDTIYLTVKVSDANISSQIESIQLLFGSMLVKTGKDVAGDKAVFELTSEQFESLKEISVITYDNAGNCSLETKPVDVTTNAISNYVMVNPASTNSINVEMNSKISSGGNNAKYQYGAESIEYYKNNAVTLNIRVEDSIVGLKNVQLTINDEKVVTDEITEFNKSLSSSMINSHDFSIDISDYLKEGKNKIEVKVTNNANQKNNNTAPYSFMIDGTAPEFTNFEVVEANPLKKALNFLTFGIFFNDIVKVKVTANDDTVGMGKIVLCLDGVEIEGERQTGTDATYVFTLPNGNMTGSQTIMTSVEVYAIDILGNRTEYVKPTSINENATSDNLMYDTELPTVTIALDDKNMNTNDGNKWYAGDVDFTVFVKDEQSGIDEVIIKINGVEVATYNESGAYNPNATYTVRTEGADGEYKIEAFVTDNAGNQGKAVPYIIYKDTKLPNITKFDFVGIEDENENNSTVEVTDYGFYFKEATKVYIYASDEAPSSGVKSITYYLVDKDEGETVITTCDVDSDGKIEIIVPAHFKGQIYAKAADNVGNTCLFVNPNGVIVETQEDHDKAEDHISFDKEDAEFTIDAVDDGNIYSNNANELYNDNVKVKINVSDPYSGIREITWSVVAPYDKTNNFSGTVTVDNNGTIDGDDGWTATSEDGSNLVVNMTKEIIVSNNSNNIVVKVTMTDRAGNTTTDRIKFSIDKTKPVVTVKYGDNEVHDSTNTNYFSTTRTATITIAERNFRKEDVTLLLERDGINIADIIWTTTPNNEDPDKTTHTAEIQYLVDGDYVFDIDYQDNGGKLADWNATEPEEFTIDMTKPTVTVSYDNTAALNGNYYKANRVATIKIKEHNFDAERVNVIGVATNGGAVTTFPATSTWVPSTTEADTYIATISYTADAKYTFDIEVRDMADNELETDYQPEEFYIDKNAPNLSITGIADLSANNGTVAPIIEYSDTNFNKNAVSISLSGVNNGAVEYTGSYATIHNGQRFTYADFERSQQVDDIYTLTVELTDMAGNSTSQTITFSVNRFGSIYTLSESADKLNGTYVKEPIDVVITETNTDELSDIKLTLFKDGETKTLVEGTDYKVDITGGEGQWYNYKYTVFAKTFAADGVYSVTVSSKDKAGNESKNDQDTKNVAINFGVDSTLPIINIENLESDTTYALDNMTVNMSVNDNLKLTKVIVELDGQEYKVWTAEELEEIVKNGGNFSFDIAGDSTDSHSLVVYAIDAAGNGEVVSEALPANAEKVEDFYVTTNLWVRYYTNKPLFFGSIAGVIVLAGLIVFLVVYKKRKNEK